MTRHTDSEAASTRTIGPLLRPFSTTSEVFNKGRSRTQLNLTEQHQLISFSLFTRSSLGYLILFIDSVIVGFLRGLGGSIRTESLKSTIASFLHVAMSLLAGLPEELLVQIVKYLLPDDVDNFINSHEEFHAIASRILPRHSELKEKYSLISCRYGDEPQPIVLLRDILQDPEIVWYVKTIDLELSEHGALVSSEKEKNEALMIAADCEKDIIKAVGVFPRMDDDEGERWVEIDHVISCFRVTVLALLVCSLTCLESIWIRDSWENGKLHHLVRRFSQTKYLDPGSPHPFSKVNHVEEGGSSAEDLMPMESFEPFSRLPSMRRYTGRFLYHIESWTPPKEKSTITSLELYECMVHIGALRSALSGIANLEEFTYECYVSCLSQPTIPLLIMFGGPGLSSPFETCLLALEPSYKSNTDP